MYLGSRQIVGQRAPVSRHRGRLRRVAAVFGVAALGVSSILALPAVAAPTVPFAKRVEFNANGAIISIGNNLLTCPESAACTAAQNGGTTNNNAYNMVHLDADGTTGIGASTFNSSASQLALPPGATVLWAGLYWGARLNAGTNGAAAGTSSNPGNNYNQVSFLTPGDVAYRTVAASTAAHDQFGPNSGSYNAYQRFADVTSIVQATGNGDYWVANVPSGTGQDRYAGWAMTVIYSAPGLPLRNLTVFDGFELVQQGKPVTVTVDGFLAPRAGAVDAQLTMIAYEGDLGASGDVALLNNTQLGTALSPGSNFFNSSNDLGGVSVTTRTPAHQNMLGFDIKNLSVSGAIPNSATSATFSFSSTGDTYYPGMLGLAINLYAPDFSQSLKAVRNLDGNVPARPGDTLEYTLTFANTGQDPAVAVVATDVLPPGTTFVDGSLRLIDPVTGATIRALTSTAGDDEGEYDPITRTVSVRLGAGATATNGGRLNCSGAGCSGSDPARAAFAFQVKINDDASATTLPNQANLAYTTQTIGTSASYATNLVVVDVIGVADVAITKILTPSPTAWIGAPLTATLKVTNAGPNIATDVVVTDTLPPGWVLGTQATSQGSCAVQGSTVTCRLGSLAVGANATVTLVGATDPSSTLASLANVATVQTSAFDPALANNTSGDTIALAPRADLGVTKTVSPANAVPGEAVTWMVQVTNYGPSEAANVRLTDSLDDAAQAQLTSAMLSGAAGSCLNPTFRAVTCVVPNLAVNETATLTLTGFLAPNLAAGDAVTNTATVSSATLEPVPDMHPNSATATVTVLAPSADVAVSKAAPDTAVAGQQIVWTVTAANLGPSDATGVVITDTLPAGLVTGSINASASRGGACTIVGLTVTCPVGDLPAGINGGAGASATVVITATIDEATTGTLPNTASVSSASHDPISENDQAISTTAVTTEFDVMVSKTANRSSLPGAIGDRVDYTITVSNNGPSAAWGVTVTDLIPLVLDVSTVTPPSGASCDSSQAAIPQPTPNEAFGLIVCTIPGPIAPGSHNAQIITIETTTNEVLADGPDVVQRVVIDADGDTNAANNVASWTLTGTPVADLALTKDAPETVTAGDTGIYTFAITNNPLVEVQAANAPVLSDILPAGVIFDGARVVSTSDGSVQNIVCAPPLEPTGGEVICQLTGNVASGTTVQVEFDVTFAADLAAGTILTNAATITEGGGSIIDPAPNNNTAQATSIVTTLADVQVTALTLDPVNPAWIGPGTQRHVYVGLTNAGPSTAQNVSFTLERTVDATVIGAITATSSLTGQRVLDCSTAVREVTCAIGAIAPGEKVDVNYVIAVSALAAPGSCPDIVTAFTTTPETSLANNVATEDIVVGAVLSNLAVTKTALTGDTNPADGDPAFVAGGTFAFQIEVTVPAAPADQAGSGYAPAQDVLLTDVLPPGFIPQGYTTSVFSEGYTGQLGGTNPSSICTATPTGIAEQWSVECNLGAVPAGVAGVRGAPVLVTIFGALTAEAQGLQTDLGGTPTGGEAVQNVAEAQTVTPLADAATGLTRTPELGSAWQATGVTTFDIIERADLQLIKTADVTQVIAGGPAGYTLTVLNAGPSDAAHVIVYESLPHGFTLDPHASQCVAPAQVELDALPAQAGEIPCWIGELAAGASTSIHIVATTDPAMTGVSPLTKMTLPNLNRARVAAQTIDPDLTNNTDVVNVYVGRETDLSVAGSTNTYSPVAGQEVTFFGLTANNGPSTAVNTTGVTRFPPGFVPVSFDVPYNNCSWDPPAPTNPHAQTWRNVSYTLTCKPQVVGQEWEAGGVVTNSVVMFVPRDTPAGPYAGTSLVTNDTPELDETNNVTSIEMVVQHVSDTRVNKELITPLLAGGPATWRVTVTNDGPSVAQNVMLSDAVPPGMTYRAASIEGGPNCPSPLVNQYPGGDTDVMVRCPMGTLGVGESATALITFDIDPGQAGKTLCNEALVGSGSLDPDATNNRFEVCTVAQRPPATDVSLAVTPATQTVLHGQKAEFTVTVTNEGPESTHGIALRLEIPEAYLSYSGTASEWPGMDATPPTSRPPDGVIGSLTFDVGELLAGERVVYQVTGTATGVPGDQHLITGVVTHNVPDSNSSNDTIRTQILIGSPETDTDDPTPSPTPTPVPTPTPTPIPTPSPTPVPTNPPQQPQSLEQGPLLPRMGFALLGFELVALFSMTAGAGLLFLRRRDRQEKPLSRVSASRYRPRFRLTRSRHR